MKSVEKEFKFHYEANCYWITKTKLKIIRKKHEKEIPNNALNKTKNQNKTPKLRFVFVQIYKTEKPQNKMRRSIHE